jgi:vancomycin resistance protein YoaR
MLAAGVLVLLALLVGFAFAGSADRLPKGVSVAGVDVGGLTRADAQRKLEQRARALSSVPVVFTAGEHTWPLRPSRLGIQADWQRAVDEAIDGGRGFWPLRGFRRLRLRLFGDDVTPQASVWRPALALHLRQFSQVIDRPHRDAALRLKGLHVVVVPGHDGVVLDRPAAAKLVITSLASLERAPVVLPLREDREIVTAGDLEQAVQQAQAVVSGPVRLQLGETRWRIPRYRIAKMLTLPHDGSRELKITGPEANRFFRRLTKRFDRPPRSADWAVSPQGVRVIPAEDGRVVDVNATSERLLAAALSQAHRLARVAVVTKQPARSTEEARALGIKGLVAGYETIYGGDPNRIHNVQLVAQLIDKTLIAPGAEFSFNDTTGERTPEKGFREAPVIINGELQTGIGGGVCQVSTTVFNAAYEAGLKITARTNHALYISHYPQGRDATVNYPDTDLKFVNDTGHWMLLRTFVGSSSLYVGLYGTPIHRRVETTTAPLRETGQVPEKRIADDTLYEGEESVIETGEPPRSTSVRRVVYTAGGNLLYDDSWFSSYSGEPGVIHYGTKPKPEPKPKPKTTPEDQTTTTTTTTEETTPDETTPAPRQGGDSARRATSGRSRRR